MEDDGDKKPASRGAKRDREENPEPGDGGDSEPAEPAEDPTLSGPSIFDTISNLNENPLLRVAAEMALENFRLCLSKSYKSTTADHLASILSLKGSFHVDEDDEYPDSYATSGVSNDKTKRGIFFNKAIAIRALSIARDYKQQGSSIDEMMNDIDVVGLIATMQQVVEHEIGHIKYHQEGINDLKWEIRTPAKASEHFFRDTPLGDEGPLDGEAGYATQRQIGEDNPKKKRDPGWILGINEGMNVKFSARRYVYQLCEVVEPDRGKLKVTVKKQNLSLDDIIKQMDYPKRSEDCNGDGGGGGNEGGGSGGRGDGDGGGNEGGSRGGRGGGRGHGGGSRGGGGRGEGGRRGHGNNRNWFSSVRGWLMRGAGHREHKWLGSCRAQMAVAMADAKPIWYPPEFNFRSNPKNPSFDQKLELMDPDEDLDLLTLAAAEARFLACDINIILCDDHWEEKYTFTPQRVHLRQD